MTTVYIFHDLIESPDTADTVVLAFGGWWDATADLSLYVKRKKITIDHANVDTDLTDFPLKVKIVNDADIGADIDAGGLNIRFTVGSDPGGPSLAYERGSFSVAGGLASGVFWVRVPTISGAANTEIYVHYHGGAAVEQADPANAWNSGFLCVHHLEQDPSGAAPQMLDSTANNHDGTSGGAMTIADLVAGASENGLDFDGSNDEVDFGNISSVFAAADLTVEAWTNPAAINTTRFLWDKRTAATAGFALWSNGGAMRSRWNGTDLTGGTIVTGSLQHLVITRSSTTVEHYINGADVGGGTTSINASNTNSVKIGRRSFSTPSTLWSGMIDEVRVSTVARSAAWIKFTYHNIAEADNEISFGPEEGLVNEGSANVSATAGITATGSAEHKGSASVGSVAGITAVGQSAAKGFSELTGVAGIAAQGYTLPTGSSTVSAIAGITSVGHAVAKGSVTFSAVAGLEAVGEAGGGASAVFGALVGIQAEGYIAHEGSVQIAAAVAISAAGRAVAQGSATFAAAVSIQTEGRIATSGQSVFSAVSRILAFGDAPPVIPALDNIHFVEAMSVHLPGSERVDTWLAGSELVDVHLAGSEASQVWSA